MKNCQIIIKRSDHHTVTYQFDDFRIAQALINILDNVAEPWPDAETGFLAVQYIEKQLYEE